MTTSFVTDNAIRAVLDGKTKPLGSLGRLETLAAQVARIQGTLQPRADSCHLVIFAGDHGMARSGVSAYPQDVTRQMVLNFLSGGAASNVFAASVGASLQVVDAGVVGEAIDHPKLFNQRLGEGTSNAIEAPAMSSTQVDEAVEKGREIGAAIEADVACFGEMGIGNTSSASLVCAKTLGKSVVELVGRGTGLDDAGLHHKRSLLTQASERMPDTLDARSALREYGGFEIAMMTGAMIGAAKAGTVVVIDGFIASAAALCASRISPRVEDNFVYAHRSAEAGHELVLKALNATPLLDLGLRLGEGTGSLLAYPLIRAAADMMRNMASFETAGVSGPA